MGSRTFKALPVTAAIAGTAVAAWSLLRLKLRGPPPYGHGRRAFDDDPLADPLTPAMHDAISKAVADEWDTRRPNGGGQKARAALRLPGPGQQVHVLPAARVAVPDEKYLPLVLRQPRVLRDAPLEAGRPGGHRDHVRVV